MCPTSITTQELRSIHTCQRVAPSLTYRSAVRRQLLLRCGDIESNPGPLLSMAQWNARGLNSGTRISLARRLEMSAVVVCFVHETHLSSEACEAFRMSGYQHFGLARGKGQKRGGTSLLVRAGVRAWDVSSCEADGIEVAAVTLQFGLSPVRVVSGYVPSGSRLTAATLDRLAGQTRDGIPVVLCLDANVHHREWDAEYVGESAGGKLLWKWCAEENIRVGNDAKYRTWRKTAAAAPSSTPDVTLYRGGEMRDWRATFHAESDHAWITFDFRFGQDAERLHTFVGSKRLFTWKKARWKEYQRRMRAAVREMEKVFRPSKFARRHPGAGKQAVAAEEEETAPQPAHQRLATCAQAHTPTVWRRRRRRGTKRRTGRAAGQTHADQAAPEAHHGKAEEEARGDVQANTDVHTNDNSNSNNSHNKNPGGEKEEVASRIPCPTEQQQQKDTAGAVSDSQETSSGEAPTRLTAVEIELPKSWPQLPNDEKTKRPSAKCTTDDYEDVSHNLVVPGRLRRKRMVRTWQIWSLRSIHRPKRSRWEPIILEKRKLRQHPPERPQGASAAQRKKHTHATVNEIADRLADAIRSSVTASVPCAVARTPPFWTPELTRLEERQRAAKSPEEKIEVAQLFRNKLRESAGLRWRAVTAKLSASHRGSWQILKAIYTPKPHDTPVMTIGDVPLSARQQANVLVKTYAAKSTRHRDAALPVAPRRPEKPFQDFCMGELQAAMRDLHLGSAPGPDNIHCESLKHLPDSAMRQLLRLFNKSVRTSTVPRRWKDGVIVPLLKPGKPAAQPASYRPVTLTSNLCKLLERMVARRIRDTVDEKLLPYQAGFRPNRSTLDPLVHVKARLLGRQQGEKVGAVFIDYARAFDSVDHGRIIEALRKYGVDDYLTRWVMDFLTHRRARVRVNNKMSNAINFTCGVPQGSVLGPLLFIIVMDTLSVELADIPDLEHAFFADDLTIFTKEKDNRKTEQTLQAGLDCIAAWTKRNYMELSAPKTQYTLFGSPAFDALRLSVDGVQLQEERNPKLLGFTFQVNKGVALHVANVERTARQRLRKLAAITAYEWGCRREVLRSFYLALVHAKMLYGAVAWWPHAAQTQRDTLGKIEYRAASIIAGVPVGASRRDVLKEARLLPVSVVVALRQMRYLLTATVAADEAQKEFASALLKETPEVKALMESVAGAYPSVEGPGRRHTYQSLLRSGRVYFNCTLPGGLTREADMAAKKVECEKRVARFKDARLQLWTDGSVTTDVKSGGAAILFDESGRIIDKVMKGAGRLACSYRSECVAMEEGLQMITKYLRGRGAKRFRRVVAVFTDSRSLLEALQTGPTAVEDGILRRIWTLILELISYKVCLSFQFVFGHCGLERNELVDKEAKLAAGCSQSVPAWITDIVTSAIRRKVRPEWIAPRQPEKTVRDLLLAGDAKPVPKLSCLQRWGETLTAQFRCGVSPRFGWLRPVVSGDKNTKCPFCRPAEAESCEADTGSGGIGARALEAEPPPRPPPPPEAPGPPVATGPCTSTHTSVSIHNWNPKAELQLVNGPSYCPMCWRSFTLRQSLRKHLQNKNIHALNPGQVRVAMRLTLKVQNNGSKQVCPVRSCTFSTRVTAALESHLKTNHMMHTMATQGVPAAAAPVTRREDIRAEEAPLLPVHPVARERLREKRARQETECEDCGMPILLTDGAPHACHVRKHNWTVDNPPVIVAREDDADSYDCPYCKTSLFLGPLKLHVTKFHSAEPGPVWPEHTVFTGRTMLARIPGTENFRCPIAGCAQQRVRQTGWIARGIKRHIAGAHGVEVSNLYYLPPGALKQRQRPQPLEGTPPGMRRCPRCNKAYAIERIAKHTCGGIAPRRRTERERWEEQRAAGHAPRGRRRLEQLKKDPIPCPICQTTFRGKEALRGHIKQVHTTASDRNKPPPTVQSHPFGCVAVGCGKVFRSRPGLGHHLRTCHPDMDHGIMRSTDGKPPSVVVIASRALGCSLCGRAYCTQRRLNTHIWRDHLDQPRQRDAPWFKNSQVEDTPEHLLVCPSLQGLRDVHLVEQVKRKEFTSSTVLANYLCAVFRLADPVIESELQKKYPPVRNAEEEESNSSSGVPTARQDPEPGPL